jgi:hypothetical protein
MTRLQGAEFVRGHVPRIAVLALCAWSVAAVAEAGQTEPAPPGPQSGQADPQSRGAVAGEPTGFEVDFRIGTIRPLEAEIGPVLVGGRIAVYPWAGDTARRFSIQFVGDYVYRGDDEAFDAALGSWTKVTDHYFTLSPALGVDLVRTEHVTLEVRGGPTVVGEERTFSLEREFVDFDNSEEFENVCDLTAFRDRCESAYDFSGHVALGLRVRPKPGSAVFFGVDYTWLTSDQHQIVGTVGLAIR